MRQGGAKEGGVDIIYAESDSRLGSKIITQLGQAIPVACLNNSSQIIRSTSPFV